MKKWLITGLLAWAVMLNSAEPLLYQAKGNIGEAASAWQEATEQYIHGFINNQSFASPLLARLFAAGNLLLERSGLKQAGQYRAESRRLPGRYELSKRFINHYAWDLDAQAGFLPPLLQTGQQDWTNDLREVPKNTLALGKMTLDWAAAWAAWQKQDPGDKAGAAVALSAIFGPDLASFFRQVSGVWEYREFVQDKNFQWCLSAPDHEGRLYHDLARFLLDCGVAQPSDEPGKDCVILAVGNWQMQNWQGRCYLGTALPEQKGQDANGEEREDLDGDFYEFDWAQWGLPDQPEGNGFYLELRNYASVHYRLAALSGEPDLLGAYGAQSALRLWHCDRGKITLDAYDGKSILSQQFWQWLRHLGRQIGENVLGLFIRHEYYRIEQAEPQNCRNTLSRLYEQIKKTADAQGKLPELDQLVYQTADTALPVTERYTYLGGAVIGQKNRPILLDSEPRHGNNKRIFNVLFADGSVRAFATTPQSGYKKMISVIQAETLLDEASFRDLIRRGSALDAAK